MSYSVVYSVVSEKVPAVAGSKYGMVFVSGLSKDAADKVAAALPEELKFLLGSEVEVKVEVQ
jgi:hypothetical protein